MYCSVVAIDCILYSLNETKAESNYERFPQTEQFPHVPRRLAHVALMATCISMPWSSPWRVILFDQLTHRPRSLSRLDNNTSRWRISSTPKCGFPSDYLLLFVINFCSSLRRRSMVFGEIFLVIRLASVISSSKRNTHLHSPDRRSILTSI
jgi:hypothetical protein